MNTPRGIRNNNPGNIRIFVISIYTFFFFCNETMVAIWRKRLSDSNNGLAYLDNITLK